eukprot:3202915-Rhodomonas_salina.1
MLRTDTLIVLSISPNKLCAIPGTVGISLRKRYALSGIDIGYNTTRSPASGSRCRRLPRFQNHTSGVLQCRFAVLVSCIAAEMYSTARIAVQQIRKNTAFVVCASSTDEWAVVPAVA